MKTEINGKLSKDALDGVEFETNDAAGIREAVKIMGNALGAKIVKSIALIFGLWSLCAQGAGFSGEHYAQLDLDENPIVVTNVTFDGLINNVAFTTWAELKALRDGSELKSGQQYRITNYVATTVQEHTQSANHPFDIIVTADSTNKLNEVARAIRHDGDTYFPKITKFEAWKIWYSLDNNTNRFEWADSANGKGVIYRMIDEFNNDVPYDFKGIKLMKYDENGSLSSLYYYTFDNDGFSGTEKSEVLNIPRDNKIAPTHLKIANTDVGNVQTLNHIIFTGGKHIGNVFGGECYNISLGDACRDNTFANDCHEIFLDGNCNENIFGVNCSRCNLGYESDSNTFGTDCYDNQLGGYCIGNRFGNNCTGNRLGLDDTNKMLGSECNNNTFQNDCSDNLLHSLCCGNFFGDNCSGNELLDSCISNTFSSNCSYNTFGSECKFNTFGQDCNENTLGGDCSNNTFGSGCYDNALNSNCYNNTFDSGCNKNTFGLSCNYNTFGSTCYNNTFDSGCNNNTFGSGCNNNTFGSYCHNNAFGLDCNNNTFGSNCDNNTFGSGCSLIKFGTASSVKSYCRYIRVGSGNRYIYINPTGTTSDSQYYQNVEIKEGVNNTKVYKTITDLNVGQTFLTTYKPANSKEFSL